MPQLIRSDDDVFELLDMTDKGWIHKVFGDITKASVAKQVTVGGISGWCAGYLLGKAGRAASMAIGGSLIVLQVANHKGIIQINWGKLEKSVNSARRTFNKDVQKKAPAVVEEVAEFVRDNMFLAGGFAGGFLIGVAC